jgi:hypothetical protein
VTPNVPVGINQSRADQRFDGLAVEDAETTGDVPEAYEGISSNERRGRRGGAQQESFDGGAIGAAKRNRNDRTCSGFWSTGLKEFCGGADCSFREVLVLQFGDDSTEFRACPITPVLGHFWE